MAATHVHSLLACEDGMPGSVLTAVPGRSWLMACLRSLHTKEDRTAPRTAQAACSLRSHTKTPATAPETTHLVDSLIADSTRVVTPGGGVGSDDVPRAAAATRVPCPRVRGATPPPLSRHEAVIFKGVLRAANEWVDCALACYAQCCAGLHWMAAAPMPRTQSRWTHASF